MGGRWTLTIKLKRMASTGQSAQPGATGGGRSWSNDYTKFCGCYGNDESRYLTLFHNWSSLTYVDYGKHTIAPEIANQWVGVAERVGTVFGTSRSNTVIYSSTSYPIQTHRLYLYLQIKEIRTGDGVNHLELAYFRDAMTDVPHDLMLEYFEFQTQRCPSPTLSMVKRFFTAGGCGDRDIHICDFTYTSGSRGKYVQHLSKYSHYWHDLIWNLLFNKIH